MRDIIRDISYCMQSAKERYASNKGHYRCQPLFLAPELQSNLLKRNSCKKFFDFHFALLFGFSIAITLILPISQLQAQLLMTSEIRSRIEYLLPTYKYSHASFTLQFYDKIYSLTGWSFVRFDANSV